MKRLFDLTTSLIGLILLFPFFLIIGICIKLDSYGPVFFKQKRVGHLGKVFVLYKFRSMRVDESAAEGSFEPGSNVRVTGIGRLLRKTKIDELPQLINVLLGEMSIVGPRPEVEKWVSAFPERWKKVHTVKPGITDNASILFRNEEIILARSQDPEKTYKESILPKKLALYEQYVVNQSLIGDIKLIFKTFIQLLT